MPIGLIFVIASRVLSYGAMATIEPTPIPYVAADYHGYNVGMPAVIKNQPPVQHGGNITWKKHWGFW